MDPFVSVIMPTYNQASTLNRAVKSVLAQSYSNFELIIVDDGSTDDTERIIGDCDDKRVKRLRLISNFGQAAARNAGIKEARAQLLAFQDSDDEWMPGKLASQVAVITKEVPDLGVVYSDMIRVFKDKSEKYFAAPSLNDSHLVNKKTGDYAVANIGIQSTLIKRESFDKVGFFNERFSAYEDLELFIRLSAHFRFYHIKEPLVRYYETDGISADVKAKARARRLLLAMYSKDLLTDKWFITKELALLNNTDVESE